MKKYEVSLIYQLVTCDAFRHNELACIAVWEENTEVGLGGPGTLESSPRDWRIPAHVTCLHSKMADFGQLLQSEALSFK